MEYSFEFIKARIYINSRRKSLAEIKAETGCDVILNGGLFNMAAFKPLCHLKADGKVYVTDQYIYWGYAWNNDSKKLHMVNDYANFDNYICCTALVRNKEATVVYYGADMGGKRGRTVIGTKDGKTIVYCSEDGSADAMTPEAMQRYCLKNGWTDAIMLDGGLSSQCITPAGEITGGRCVHNVLCFWIEGNKTGNSVKEGDAGVEGQIVHVYSRAKDGLKKLSDNFKVNEFACQDGSDPVFVSPALMDILQQIRDHFGKPVNITSGFRSASHNKAVGGSTYSQHQYGTAADIVVSGESPTTVAAYARSLMQDYGGVGIYSWGVHVDVRKDKTDWNG